MISMNEMMLNPRQRPKSPPREATKSTGPILMLRSNSGKDYRLELESTIYTHDSVFAKEDVNNSNVLLPSIVEVTLEINVG